MACCCPPRDDGDLQADTPQRKLLHGRRCTDCCCLLLLLTSLGVGALLASAAFDVGDPGLLTHGKDYTGRLCGLDPERLDTPKLYYPRLARDFFEYQREDVSDARRPSWTIPIYAVCVAECPQAGDHVDDYGCQAPRHPGCKWQPNPLARHERYGQWQVGVATRDLVNRCVPYADTQRSAVELCALPNCEDAQRPCYEASFAEQKYWEMATPADRLHCLRAVDIAVSRTFTQPDAGRIESALGQSVGGLFGAASDVRRAWLEVLAFGLVAAVILNLLLLLLLRCAIRTLFYVAVSALLALMLLFDMCGAWNRPSNRRPLGRLPAAPARSLSLLMACHSSRRREIARSRDRSTTPQDPPRSCRGDQPAVGARPGAHLGECPRQCHFRRHRRGGVVGGRAVSCGGVRGGYDGACQ